MKYREFGSCAWEISILGFGAARLPFREDNPGCIDEIASIELIRYALDQGVNYLDLGYPFDLKHHERVARVVGEALQDGYREKIRIAVTLPSHLIHSTADLESWLNRQLGWLRTERADFCLLGRLNRENWPVLQGLGALSWIDAALRENRIDGVGFSFHDHFQVLKSILHAYERWSLCHFQFSYMDIDHDPGISGIKYAAGKGLAAIVTEPLRSGRLIREPPEPVANLWAGFMQKRSLIDWGLRFVWNYPEVATAVSAMSSIREAAESVALADCVEPDSLTVQEEVLISQVRDAHRKLGPIPCASCRPCMPCPEAIDVPRIFEVYNDAFIYNDVETARSIYRNEGHHADYCNACRSCENRCVKKLSIVDWLEQAYNLLSR